MERPGDGFRACMNERDYDAVVAVGGDGTINEVLDGVMQSGNPHLRMGVLYSGTSPDFCRFHGIPATPQKALEAFVAGNVSGVDVARIEYRDGSGSPRISHFGCSCNIGLGASVARFANRVRRFLGDTLGTGAAVFRALILSPPADMKAEADGVECRLGRVNNLSIIKNPNIASGLKLDLNVRPDDGKLFLVAVHGMSRLGLCALLPGFYSGRAASSGNVFIKECSRVKICAEQEGEIEFDGDPRGCLPVEVRVMPKALNLIGCDYE
jgi:diacylglycerol kinase family enzyme